MAHIAYYELWESKFDNIVSKRDKLQDLNINQLKLEVHDTYRKDEKLTTNFKPVNDSDVINKAYLDEKLNKMDGHISYTGNDYNDFKSQNNKQSAPEILIQRAVRTNMQKLYNNELFDNFANAEEIKKNIFCLLQDVEMI